MRTAIQLPIHPTETGTPASELLPALVSLWTDQVHYLALTEGARHASELLDDHLQAELDGDHVLLWLDEDAGVLNPYAMHALTLAMGMETGPTSELLDRAGWTGALPTLAHATQRSAALGAFEVDDDVRAIDGPCRCALCGLVHARTETIGPLLTLLHLPETTGEAAELLRHVLHPSATLLEDLLSAADQAAPASWSSLARCLYDWLPRLPSEALPLLDTAWTGNVNRQGVVLPVLAAQGDQRSKLFSYVVEHIDDGDLPSRVAVDVATSLGGDTMSSLTSTLVPLFLESPSQTVRESVILGWLHTWMNRLPPDEVLDALEKAAAEQGDVGNLARMARDHWTV